MTLSLPSCPMFVDKAASEEAVCLSLPDFPDIEIQLISDADAIRNRFDVKLDASRWLSPSWMAFQASELKDNPTYLVLITDEHGNEHRLCAQTFTFQVGNNIHQADQNFNWRRWIASPFKFKVLVLGQMLTSGPYASSLDPHEIDGRWAKLLDQLSVQLANHLSCSATMLKDLVEANSESAVYWQDQQYYRLPVDPVMQLPIRQSWASFDDYLLDLTSKYRVRYRRARKQADGINKRRIPPAKVSELQPEMDELFQSVRITADYDPIDPPPGYFTALQEAWRAHCQIDGYYLDGELVGFTTALFDGGSMHAHYLGFDQEVNRSHHLYHNMLFDLIETAIEERADLLNFSRTALEIKSSVGAEPQEYAVMLRSNSRFGNWLIRSFTPRLFQAQEWQRRNPFKS
ncbi:MAG: GNAT family N-acetyltransferase [Bacteroidota bacterium]